MTETTTQLALMPDDTWFLVTTVANPAAPLRRAMMSANETEGLRLLLTEDNDIRRAQACGPGDANKLAPLFAARYHAWTGVAPLPLFAAAGVPL